MPVIPTFKILTVEKEKSICFEQAFNLDCKSLLGSQSVSPAADSHLAICVLRLSLKEVIQPHLPIGLPCYDFIPVIGLTLGTSLLAVESVTSGKTNSHDVTGGVYKARERIHGVVADTPLLAIPTSCSRVADYNLN